MNGQPQPLLPEPFTELAAYYRRSGYTRLQNPDRLSTEGYRAYKKGDELRLVAYTFVELRAIRRLLKAAGFVAGKPFRKGRQWRQPVYGRAEVARFLGLVNQAPEIEAIPIAQRQRPRRGPRR